MPPKQRRSLKRKTQGAVPQEASTSNVGPVPDAPKLMKAPDPFLWTVHRTLALLYCMKGRKPAGLHKHLNVMLIQADLSKRLKMVVPIKEIWKFLHAHWDMKLADRIENQVLEMLKPKDFELPKTDEWARLIKEEGELIMKKEIEEKKAKAEKQKSQAATSRVVDLNTLKTVKIVLERMDGKYLNKSFNNLTTLKNGPNDVQAKSTSSNVSIGVKKKHANNDRRTGSVVRKKPKN